MTAEVATGRRHVDRSRERVGRSRLPNVVAGSTSPCTRSSWGWRCCSSSWRSTASGSGSRSVPIVAVAILGIVVSVVLRLVIGERDRAGFASFITMVALIGGDPRLLLVALLLVAILVVEARVLRGRLRVSWPLIGRASRAFALLLCLAIVVQAVQLGAVNVIGRSLTNEGPLRPAPVFAGTDSPTTPDIYVILLDGYARADALKQVFGVDESGFLGQLEERGFGVSSRALTNYPNTVQVLMAMFNMRLLPDIPALQPCSPARTPRRSRRSPMTSSWTTRSSTPSTSAATRSSASPPGLPRSASARRTATSRPARRSTRSRSDCFAGRSSATS